MTYTKVIIIASHKNNNDFFPDRNKVQSAKGATNQITFKKCTQ